jgi:PAS domain S-box-containing protein
MQCREPEGGNQLTKEQPDESERRYRDLADSLPQTVVEIDIAGNITFANVNGFVMFGYMKEDFTKGLNIFQMIVPEEHKRAKENIQKSLKGQETEGEEYTGLKKDGGRFPVMVYMTPILQENMPVGFRAIVIDISERKKREDALRASQTQLSEAMDIAYIVHWEVDLEEKVFIFNDNFYALCGTTAEQEGGYRMPGKEYIKRFIHPDDQLHISHRMGRNVTVPGLELLPDLEHRIVRRDGEVRHILARTKIVRDNSGRLIKKYGTNQDITERKRAEEAFHNIQIQLSEAADLAKIVYWEVDLEEKVFIFNDTFYALYGTTAEQEGGYRMPGKEYIKRFIHPDDQSPISHRMGRNVTIPGLELLPDLEHRIVRRDGEVRHILVRTKIVRDDSGHIVRRYGTNQDVTERKRSEEERANLETQLFHAQKMEAIGTLTGGIAHDFNNILTALVGYAALLKMNLNGGILCRYVDQILSASQKATDLVRSLLAFSRQQAISLKPVNIDDIVRATEKLLKRLVTEDIVIKTVLATKGIITMADATQIDQILFNLATNARDAMPCGGILTIGTRVMELDDEFRRFHGFGVPGRYVLLSLSDTGVGMDETTRERIFDPFFTTKEVGKGTGLGLSTVYGIVKQHKGYVTAYSEPNVGTTFNIYLPVIGEAGEEERFASAPVKGGSETILVGEDNAVVRGLVSTILIEYGYTTIEAVDGEDAVEQFKKVDTIDLLILDSVMPKKNGREAYAEIYAIKPDIRVIFTSGHTRDVLLDKGIEEGKLNFLQKPILPHALLEKVREVLDDKGGTDISGNN